MIQIKGGDGDTNEEFLLDVLFSHKLSWVRELLRLHELPVSGTAPELRDRVTGYLKSGELACDNVVEILDLVEGWGDQHIYLYKASDVLLTELSDEARIRAALKKNRVGELLNAYLPLVLPEIPTLSTIEWAPEQLRFVWIEKRIYRDRVADEDLQEDDLEFDAFKRRQTRGIIAFQCDLVSGDAWLSIQRLPTGNDYQSQRTHYESHLKKFFDFAHLTPCAVSSAIKKLDSAKGIRKRSSELTTQRGYRVAFTSRSRREDVYGDPDIRKSRKSLGGLMAGRMGNYYWPIDGRDIHIKLYAKDQRIGIFGECTQEEVKNVLAEIRGYC